MQQKQQLGRSVRLPKTLKSEEAVRRLYEHMKERASSESYKNRKPSYNSVTYWEEWKDFYKFQLDIQQIHGYQDWLKHYSNPKEFSNPIQLDKDLMNIYLGYENKIYSPETILLIRREVNFYIRDLERIYSQEEIRSWLIEFELLEKLNHLEDLKLLEQLKELVNKKINTCNQQSTDFLN